MVIFLLSAVGRLMGPAWWESGRRCTSYVRGILWLMRSSLGEDHLSRNGVDFTEVKSPAAIFQNTPYNASERMAAEDAKNSG
ncbi:MAG: hypothetical protein MSS13_04590 [Sutterella parvirubra]|nr:hypothetical protein [Sutterella parvirubra]MCI7708985.1 hypothetical protein [Sutterella parvirubra]MDR3770316.1 hypothetical protein [Sutterella sp.]MDY5202294.1 hypothetical protein [Sutterella parvirubra]